MRVDLADVLVDLEARLVGQSQVEKNYVGRPGANPLKAFGTGSGDLDPVGRSGVCLEHLSRDQRRGRRQ